jgi:hypothetical protein
MTSDPTAKEMLDRMGYVRATVIGGPNDTSLGKIQWYKVNGKWKTRRRPTKVTNYNVKKLDLGSKEH